MSDLKELIERELESFIEWDGDDKSIVTTTSAKLFAEHVAKIYADHVAGARKMVAAVQGEPVGEVRFEFGVPSSIFAELYSKSLPTLAPGTKLYAAPQPAEQQQPSLQSPPDDPLGGLEHRADGESNFYTLSRPTGNWVARIQFNGELHTHEQERILNAMLSDRNVRYGDGYHQGYWDARQKSPNVAGLTGKMGRLIAAGNRLNAEAEECTYDDGMAEVAGSEYWCEFRDALEAATEALAAHRKQGGE